ncbi:MAG: Gfo/Idh/MocA family oxidoreductase [Deltaproteobacteria bacterium]|nr:Gfo/Idh/MocA family oxidoreductase [Deltaproteobacteria bacterium]
MGTNRVEAFRRIPQTSVRRVVDLNESSAEKLAATCHAQYSTRWEDVVRDPDLDAIIVAIYHNVSFAVTRAALEFGKHVLCEKPLGRTAEEALVLVQQAKASGRILKTGFNYRHYPGIRKAHRLVLERSIGDLRYLRMILGHGARPGYDREWRTDAIQGGGGALLDPGIHCLDLIRWFCGEPRRASCHRMNAFWKTPYEDNAFTTFETEGGIIAFVQTSITEWRNKFSFEAIGTDGYIKVEGRGGSYGPQTIRHAPRWGWLKTPPAEETLETFPEGDESFYEETKEFVNSIREDREPLGNGRDGLRAMEIIERIYHAKNPHDILFA